MAKTSGDLILRDRMQFDIDAGGERTTLYGRFDLSQFTDPVSRMGLAIKEVYFQFRNSGPGAASGLVNTGGFDPVAAPADSALETRTGCLKVYATTRAYENASEVGIASPDVLCVYERYSTASPAYFNAGALESGQAIITENLWYGPRDLHPAGYTVVSDLLVGIASDNWLTEGDQTIELDVVLVAEPVKVTTERMNEILSQQQDL
jgi:hypothetical protein